jgi:hypothetical protein
MVITHDEDWYSCIQKVSLWALLGCCLSVSQQPVPGYDDVLGL